MTRKKQRTCIKVQMRGGGGGKKVAIQRTLSPVPKGTQMQREQKGARRGEKGKLRRTRFCVVGLGVNGDENKNLGGGTVRYFAGEKIF